MNWTEAIDLPKNAPVKLKDGHYGIVIGWNKRAQTVDVQVPGEEAPRQIQVEALRDLGDFALIEIGTSSPFGEGWTPNYLPYSEIDMVYNIVHHSAIPPVFIVPTENNPDSKTRLSLTEARLVVARHYGGQGDRAIFANITQPGDEQDVFLLQKIES